MPLKKVENNKWATLLPKGYLSPSAVESFLLCPHAWYLRYVIGVRPLGIYPATQEGKAMHAMLEENNREKVNTGDDMKPKQAVECFQDHWSDYSKEVTNWDGEKKDTISERGEAQSNNYIKKHASKYVADPDGIEKKISFEIAGIPFLGFIDFQGESTMKDPGSSIGVRTDKVILDYKNVKSAKSLTELKTGIQMGVYAEATGIRTVEYISFVKTKSPRIDKKRAVRSDQDQDNVVRVIQGVADAIKKGSFPYCNPSSWKCCERYCDVHYQCAQGKGKL